MVRVDLKRTIAVIVLLGTIVAIASGPGEAAARHRTHVVEHQRWSSRARAAQASVAQAPNLGAMRYYGGPKSPMWRAPAVE